MNTEKHPQQKIEGRLFHPFVDDSAWCDIEVEYSVLTENPGEGASSQRMVVKRVPKGSRAQFGLADFPLRPNEEILLRFLAKSPDSTPVTVNVMQRKPPYTTYFTQVIQPAAEWREFQILIPGMFDDAETRLQFGINQPGTFDLDHFRAERRESTALKIPEERLANLLPSSGFPLGAAPPWLAHGFASTEVGELRGPTGYPALVLNVRRQPGFARFEQSLRMGFRALPKKPLTVRVSANLLEGDMEISLRAGVEKIWESPFAGTFKLQPGWNVYEHTVELPPSPRGYYQLQIAFEGQGKAAVDRVQAAQGGGPFALAGPVELALDSTAPFGLAEEGEPFRIRLAAWGRLEQAQAIILELENLDGQKVEVGRYPMPTEPFVPVEAEMKTPAGFPEFGSFRLEARAVDARGQIVGVPAELLLHRVRPARFAGQRAPQSFFGIHYRTSHLDSEGLAVLKKLGFNWLRLFKTFSWKRIEAEQGTLDFSQTDQDVALLEEHKMEALGILGDGAPAWAAKNRDPEFRGWACWTPRDPELFADFAGKIFERYGDKVTAYEPWNEPYYPGFFTERIDNGQRIMGSAADYFKIQKLVFERARASGKNLQIGWNTNTLAEIHRTKEWLELGILDYVDFISLHHYLGQPDPAPEITLQVKNLRELLGSREKPIWNSEGGLGPFTLFNLYQHTPPVQEASHHLQWADWYVRYHLACMAAGVKHYFVYLWSAPNFWMPDYSVNNVDGRISANLTAISALAWMVDGLEFVTSRALAGNKGRAEVFRGKERMVGCVIPAAGQKLTLPARPQGHFYDLFGNALGASAKPQDKIFYVEAADEAALEAALGAL